MSPGAAPASRSPRVAALACTLLLLLLPTLVVLRSIGEPAAPGERQRLQRIVEGRPPGDRIDSGVSRLFHGAAVAGEAWPDEPAAQRDLLVRARLAQVAGVTGMALLTYLAVLLARGRLQALLACAAVAVLPPVFEAGYVLRVETAASLFAVLSVVLLQAASLSTSRHRPRSPRRAAAVAGGLMFCAAGAIAMTCEALPSLGEALLVPGVVLLLGAVQMLVRGRRLLLRRGLLGTPIRAINRRLIPWTAVGLIAPALALWLLSSSYTVAVESLAVSARSSPLLPDGTVAFALAATLLAIGAGAMMVRVGMRFGRGGRISPELILFAFCAVFLLTALGGERQLDPLPLVPAAAAVLSEGLHVLLVLLLGALARRR
ncbi:MAG: hypothetical protein KAI24_05565 [Planctomycetes bacterium]|nr:hypothetical protein [Planctomycetota bacterium]